MPDPTDADSPGPVTSPEQTDPQTGTDLANLLTSSGVVTSPDQPTADGDSPVAAPQSPAMQSAVGSGPQLVSVSSSHKGLPGGAKRAGDLFSRADQQADDDEAPYRDQTTQEMGQVNHDYGALADATADQGKQTQAFYAQQAELQHRIGDFYQTQAKFEQRASAVASAVAQQHLAAYQEQLAGVRNLMKVSGDPLGQLTFGQAAGLGFAQFAQGFLAARGINIDVSGQIDKWVNRSIQEHQQAIQNARGVADDEVHLYEIARQTSQDEFEARQRYRGFVTEGLKSSLEANASQFQSNVAVAQARATAAKLDIEQQKTQGDLYDRMHTQTLQFHQLRITEATDRGKLEIEREANALKARAQDLKAKALQNTQPDLPQYFTDNSDVKRDDNGQVTSGGRVRGIWNPKAAGVAGDEKNLSEAVAYQTAADKGADILTKLRTGEDLGHWLNDKTSQKYRDFDAARTEMGDLLLNMRDGKRINQQEYERRMASLQDDKAWQSGANDGLVQNLRDFAHVQTQSRYNAATSNGTLVEVNPNQIDARAGTDDGGYRQRPQANLDPVGQSDLNAHVGGNKPVPTEIGEDVHDAVTPPSRRTVETPISADEAFADPSKAMAAARGETEQKPAADDVRVPSRLHKAIWGEKGAKPDAQTDAVDRLAYAAVAPKYFRRLHEGVEGAGAIPDDNKLVTKQALDGLREIAAGKAERATSLYVQVQAQRVLQMYEDGTLADAALSKKEKAAEEGPSIPNEGSRLRPNGQLVTPNMLPPGMAYDPKTDSLVEINPRHPLRFHTGKTDKENASTEDEED